MSAAGARRPKRPMLWMDFIVLDERGYLPFAQSGGPLLFHPISRLYKRSSIIVITGDYRAAISIVRPTQ
jgi:DNA replication protein DnaC